MARWKIKFNAAHGKNLSDSIMSLIKDFKLYRVGWKDIGNVFELYNSFMPWVFNDKFLSIRFEDLVGPNGGGTLESQQKTIYEIADFIGVRVDEKRITDVVNDIFGGTPTFNEGQIDGWKKYFTDEHKKAFKKVAGRLLIDLGYEKDLNW
jgi:hypothetical protein